MNKTLRIALCGLNEQEAKTTQQSPSPPGDTQNASQPEPEQKMITMSGPLGEVYTKALAVMFAKKNEVTGEVTLESQANDAIMALAVARTIFNANNQPVEGVADLSKQIASNVVKTDLTSDINAYVVPYDDVTPEDVATAAIVYSLDKKSKPKENYFVIDYNHQDHPNSIPVNFNLQSHCDDLNLKLVLGMESFVKIIKDKKAGLV